MLNDLCYSDYQTTIFLKLRETTMKLWTHLDLIKLFLILQIKIKALLNQLIPRIKPPQVKSPVNKRLHTISKSQIKFRLTHLLTHKFIRHLKVAKSQNHPQVKIDRNLHHPSTSFDQEIAALALTTLLKIHSVARITRAGAAVALARGSGCASPSLRATLSGNLSETSGNSSIYKEDLEFLDSLHQVAIHLHLYPSIYACSIYTSSMYAW